MALLRKFFIVRMKSDKRGSMFLYVAGDEDITPIFVVMRYRNIAYERLGMTRYFYVSTDDKYRLLEAFEPYKPKGIGLFHG